MRLELLTVADCPNRATALTRLREALERVGAGDLPIDERVIDDPDDAAVARMHGSPTILVDGRDPFASDDELGHVSCRLYRSPDGTAGAPTVDDLVAALRLGLEKAKTESRQHCCEPIVLADDDAARELGVRGFRALWRGETPLLSTLTDAADVVDRQVIAGRLEVDDRGALVGVHGLVRRVTRHRIEHDGGSVNTWCALDAIGIPVALGINAAAVTSCPACGKELRVRIRAGSPVDGDELRLWLPTGVCDHLVEDFCTHANLYCDEAHLGSAVPAGDGGRVLTVAELASIGREIWRDVADEMCLS